MYTGSPDPKPDRIYPLKAPSQTGRRIAVIIFISCFLLIALLKQNAVFVLPLFLLAAGFTPIMIWIDRGKAGIAPGSELRTSEDRIALYVHGILQSEIRREALHTGILTFSHLDIWKTVNYEFYVVFSEEATENLSHDELIGLIRAKKAFAFPEDERLRGYEPDLFH